jgi:hypothetical protein
MNQVKDIDVCTHASLTILFASLLPLSLPPEQDVGTGSHHVSLLPTPLPVLSLSVQFHFCKIRWKIVVCDQSQIKHTSFILNCPTSITCYIAKLVLTNFKILKKHFSISPMYTKDIL